MKVLTSIVSAGVCFLLVCAANAGLAKGTTEALSGEGTATTVREASGSVSGHSEGADRSVSTRIAPKKLAVVSAGTSLTVRIGQPVGTKTAKEGDRFTGTLAAPVLIDGKTILPRGSKIEGLVIRSQRGLGPAGKPELKLKLTHIAVRNRFLPVSSNHYSVRADRESRFKGSGKEKTQMLKNVVVTESDILIRPGTRLVFFLLNPLAVGVP